MTYRTRTEWLKKGLYIIPHAKPTAKTNKGESLFKDLRCNIVSKGESHDIS